MRCCLFSTKGPLSSVCACFRPTCISIDYRLYTHSTHRLLAFSTISFSILSIFRINQELTLNKQTYKGGECLVEHEPLRYLGIISLSSHQKRYSILFCQIREFLLHQATFSHCGECYF